MSDYDISRFTGEFDLVGMTEAEKLAFIKANQTTNPQIITATDTVITASDEVYFGDVTDSTKLKKDTVQGILDLVPAPDLSSKLNIDQTTSQTTVGVFSFPEVNSYIYGVKENYTTEGIPYQTAHYKCNETTGTTIEDSQGTNEGTASTDASNLTTSGKINTALQFNGSSEYVTVPNSASFQPGTDDFSVAFWINLQGYGAENTWKGFIDMRSWTAGTENGWSIGTGTRSDFPDYHKISTHFTDSDSGWDMVSDGTNCSDTDIAIDTWQHWVVVFSRSDGTVKFYLNGALDTSETPTSGYPTLGVNPTITLLLGKDHRNGYFPVTFDDIRVVKRALSLSEIQDIYNSGNGTEADGEEQTRTRDITLANDVFSFEKGIAIPNDNEKLFLGTGKDSSVSYDGTDMVINPKEVGSGCLKVSGDLNVDGLTASKVVFTDADKKLTSTGIGTSAQFIKGDGSLDSGVYALANNVLALDNTTAFTPDADYEPATKKYVDDNAGGEYELTASDILMTQVFA